MTRYTAFSKEALNIDAAEACAEIVDTIREALRRFRKRGVVVGLSGGIDSSVVAALSVRALGKDRVFGLFMPEADSSDESLELGRLLAGSLGIQTRLETITPILTAAGCYRRRDEAIKSAVTEYGESYKSKIVLSDVVANEQYATFSVVVEAPDGRQTRARLSHRAYLEVVAATNFKQRTRKMLEYYYADQMNYAVAGTPNRLEYDQGFFVKLGDGAADLKPIAHLYKSQVYAMAEYLEVPAEIRRRPPTTDTYSLPQSQEEFYYALPYQQMDLCLYAKDNGIPAVEVAAAVGLSSEQIDRVYRMIDSKRRIAEYLHATPVLVDAVHGSAS